MATAAQVLLTCLVLRDQSRPFLVFDKIYDKAPVTQCWLRNAGHSTARITRVSFTPDGGTPRDCGLVDEVPAGMAIYALDIPLEKDKENTPGLVSVTYRNQGCGRWELKARPDWIRSNQWQPR
jgi:hypothetical protein